MKRKDFLRNSLLGAAGLGLSSNLGATPVKKEKSTYDKLMEPVGFNHLPNKEIKTMKTVLHKADSRGHANHGWLNSHHSFSFANYYNPDRVHFGVLRVLNDDVVAPGRGFGRHPHDNMEIVSIPLSGALEHKDSMDNKAVIKAGDVQVMSAGTGVMHSEFNDSDTNPVHFLQIWITPKVMGTKPRYEQKRIEQNGKLTPLVTADGRDGSLTMQQDASLYRLQLEANESIELDLAKGYLHLIEGALTLSQVDGSSVEMKPGDGFGFSELTTVVADEPAHALLFELPADVH